MTTRYNFYNFIISPNHKLFSPEIRSVFWRISTLINYFHFHLKIVHFMSNVPDSYKISSTTQTKKKTTEYKRSQRCTINNYAVLHLRKKKLFQLHISVVYDRS